MSWFKDTVKGCAAKMSQSCTFGVILGIERNLHHGHFHPVQMASF